MNKTLVLGLGNILMMDEGFGVHVVEALRSNYSFSPAIDIIDGGTAGLDLLPYIEGRENVIFIDAVNFRREPGFVAMLQDSEIPSALQAKLSVHHIGLPDLIFALRLMDKMPKSMTLIGVQPACFDSQIGLSDILKAQVPTALQMTINKLKECAIECVLQCHQK